MNQDELETAWREECPSCRSCGWSNAFYEISDALEPTDQPGEYWAPCRSKDADDADMHRGYFFYPKAKA